MSDGTFIKPLGDGELSASCANFTTSEGSTRKPLVLRECFSENGIGFVDTVEFEKDVSEVVVGSGCVWM